MKISSKIATSQQLFFEQLLIACDTQSKRMINYLKLRLPKEYSIIQNSLLSSLVIFVSVIMFAVFAARIVMAQQPINSPQSTPAIAIKSQRGATTPTLPAVLPVGIQIDDINVEAPIIPVGQLASGEIETPRTGQNVSGWYKYSPMPGQLGPAVIVGHLDSTKGISVFWNLHKLKTGAMIRISRADGSIATFDVNQVAQYDQNNFPTESVYGNISYAGLRLITCGGVFDAVTHHYSQNTVVYASLVLPDDRHDDTVNFLPPSDFERQVSRFFALN